MVRPRLTTIWSHNKTSYKVPREGEEKEVDKEKRWEDIKERTGLEIANSQRVVGKDEWSWLQSRQSYPNDPYGFRESELK